MMYVNITSPAEYRDRPTPGFEKFVYLAEPPPYRHWASFPSTIYCRSSSDFLRILDYFTLISDSNYVPAERS